MNSKFSNEVSRLAKLKGLTQSDIASHLDMHTSSFQYKLKHNTFVLDELKKLSKLLGIKAEDLTAMLPSANLNIEETLQLQTDLLLQHDSMLRTILIALAESVAHQRGVKVAVVLKELTDSVNRLSGDSLKKVSQRLSS